MTRITVSIDDLIPTEPFLSERKLARIRHNRAKGLFLPPIIVVPYGPERKSYLIYNGNHRAFGSYEKGDKFTEAETPRLYRHEIDAIIAAADAEISHISQLKDRVLTHSEWQRLKGVFGGSPEDNMPDEEYFRTFREIRSFCIYLNQQTHQ